MATTRTLNAARPIRLSDPINAHHPLNEGRVSWLLTLPGLDGGTTWYDLMLRSPGTLTSMGNGSNGWRPTTRKGGAGDILFDGTAGYVTGPSPHRTFPLALAGWAKLASTSAAGGQDQIVASVAKTSGLEEFWIGYFGTTAFRAVCQGGGSAASFNWTITMDLAWHRFLAIFTSSVAMAMYIDGVPGVPGGSTAATVTPAALDTLYAGALKYNSSNLYGTFGGHLDDVTVWTSNPLMVSSPGAFAATDYELSCRGYPGVLNRRGRSGVLAASGSALYFPDDYALAGGMQTLGY